MIRVRPYTHMAQMLARGASLGVAARPFTQRVAGEVTYDLLDAPVDCGWSQDFKGFDSPRQYVAKQYGSEAPKTASWSDISGLFKGRNVWARPNGGTMGDALYIGGTDVPYSYEYQPGKSSGGGIWAGAKTKSGYKCVFKDFQLYSNPWVLITPDGPWNVPRWLYRVTYFDPITREPRKGLGWKEIYDSVRQHYTEVESGMLRTCGEFGEISPEQARSLLKVGPRTLPSNWDCLVEWAKVRACPASIIAEGFKTVPYNGSPTCGPDEDVAIRNSVYPMCYQCRKKGCPAGFVRDAQCGSDQHLELHADQDQFPTCGQCVANPPPDLGPCPTGSQKYVGGPSLCYDPQQAQPVPGRTDCYACVTPPPPPACMPGYERAASGDIACGQGYRIDTDSSGCQKCSSDCPAGHVPGDQAASLVCTPGQSQWRDTITGCVHCAKAPNCYGPGEAAVPCAPPFVVAARGPYMCCVASATPPSTTPTTPPEQEPGSNNGNTYPDPTEAGVLGGKGWIIGLLAVGATIFAVKKLGTRSDSDASSKDRGDISPGTVQRPRK